MSDDLTKSKPSLKPLSAAFDDYWLMREEIKAEKKPETTDPQATKILDA